MTEEQGAGAGPEKAAPVDPVLARRDLYRRIIVIATRAGYALYGLAIVGFVLGFVRNFDGLAVTIIQIGLIGGSILLAPAMTFVYAIKAADRADRDDDWR